MATLAPPIEDPGLDLYANQAGRLRGANIVLVILPTIFVALRLASRKISRAGYWVSIAQKLESIGYADLEKVG